MGLNPWCFKFWEYPRLGPRPSLAPPKRATGSASVCDDPSNPRQRGLLEPPAHIELNNFLKF